MSDIIYVKHAKLQNARDAFDKFIVKRYHSLFKHFNQYDPVELGKWLEAELTNEGE